MDDHQQDGSCLMCKKVGGPCGLPDGIIHEPPLSPAKSHTVTLLLWHEHRAVKVEMPAATTVRYAAKRAAAAVGFDADAQKWVLAEPATRHVYPPDSVVAALDGAWVVLGWTQ